MIDGDDLLLSNSLQEIIKVLTDRKPDLIISKLKEIKDSEKINIIPSVRNIKIRQKTQCTCIKDFLIHKKFQGHFTGKFIKRGLFNGHFFPEFKCYEDLYLLPSLLSASKNILYCKDSIYYYIKRAGSLSDHIDIEKLHLREKAVEEIDRIFGHKNKWKNLIVCHAIEVLIKSSGIIHNYDSPSMRSIIESSSVISFLISPYVRMKYKKILLKS